MRMINLFGRQKAEREAAKASAVERLSAAAAQLIAEYNLPIDPIELLGQGLQTSTPDGYVRWFVQEVDGYPEFMFKQYTGIGAMSVRVTRDGAGNTMPIERFAAGIRSTVAKRAAGQAASEQGIELTETTAANGTVRRAPTAEEHQAAMADLRARIEAEEQAAVDRLVAAAAELVSEFDLPIDPAELLGQGLHSGTPDAYARWFIQEVNGHPQFTFKQYDSTGGRASVPVTPDGAHHTMPIAQFAEGIRAAVRKRDTMRVTRAAEGPDHNRGAGI